MSKPQVTGFSVREPFAEARWVTQMLAHNDSSQAAAPGEDVKSVDSDAHDGLLCLAQLSKGQSGTIVQLDGASDQREHLTEIGLALGAQVRLVQLGNPCIVRVQEARLALDVDHARSVWVRPIESSR